MGYRVRHKGVPNGMTYEDYNGKERIVLFDGTGSAVARGDARRIAYDSTNNRLCAKALASTGAQQQVVIAAEPCAASKKGEYYIKGSAITLTVPSGTYTADDGLAVGGGAVKDTGSAYVGNMNEFGAVETGAESTTSVTCTLFGKEIANTLEMAPVMASQTTENNCADFGLTSDSTYVSGTNMTYSQGYGSSAIKASGTWSGATGGFSGVLSIVDWDTACATNGNGVVGIKSIVRSTDVTSSDGEFYSGMFIARKDGSGTFANEVSVIGLEGWFYETGTGEIGTGIGGNFGYHCDSTDAAHGAGSVHRGVQIFCDNSGTSDAAETTALCLWNLAGGQDNAIRVVQSATGFTNFLQTDNTTGFVNVNTHSIDSHALQHTLVVDIGGDTGYIPVFAADPA